MAGWIDILRKEVEAKGPVQVAKELGVSRTTVDLVCAGKYGAKTDNIKLKIQNIYGENGMINCKVLGQITPNLCAKKWVLSKSIGMKASNPDTIILYHTCRTCSVRNDTGGGKS